MFAPFVPQTESEAVKKLKAALRLDTTPIKVRCVPEPGAKVRNCFEIVDARVRGRGGQMRIGWTVWQHGNIFIEGEFHAVHDPGEGQPWIDYTPREMRFGEILFIPDPTATYDLQSTDLIDNCRVPLQPDPRIQQALDYFSEKTRLMNNIPGVNVAMPPNVVFKIQACVEEASRLLSHVDRAQQPRTPPKVGRNDPCPCGSGRKYKRCHGA